MAHKPCLALLLAVTVIFVVAARPAGAQVEPNLVGYSPPVDAPVVDAFRPPSTPYGPGNRGLEYAVAVGTPVRASADGEVVFAGPVAGTRHVTLRHADGLRTSYSYLSTLQVRTGMAVHRGDVLGRTGDRLHFGVRDPDDTYLDPAPLFEAPTRPHVRLVPGADDGVAPLQARERASFLRLVLDQAGARLPLLLHYAEGLRPDVRASRLVDRLAQQQAAQGDCTPTDAAVEVATGRHVVVLVGGLGSTSESAAIDRVDTAALGVAAADVVRFSYDGGRVPDTGDADAFDGIEARPYTADDTHLALDIAADRLTALLRAVAEAQPGVPIDVVAHSQGGVVARLAVARAGADGSLPPEVVSLATIAAPFGGADLATAAQAARGAPVARAVLGAAGQSVDAASIAQLSEVSALTADATDLHVPDRIARVSIAARGDVVVPSAHSLAAEFPAAVVDLAGVSAHDRLPGAAATTRELTLLRAGRAPTCRSGADLLVDAVVGEGASWAEDAVGALVLTGAVPGA